MIAPLDLWAAKRGELFAQRGQLTYQIGQLEARLRSVDEALRALDTTHDLAAGLDAEAAKAPPEAAEPPK
jgi:hypothetical protein